MSARLVYSAIIGDFEKKILELQTPIAKASTAAVKEAAGLAQAESKSELSSAGFSARSAKAMRVTFTPKEGNAIDAKADFFLRPAYLNVFEEGATISGKPLLWLPLETVPLGVGGKRLTPKQYIDRVGPLHSAKNAPKPMLVGKGSRAQILRATSKAVKFRKKAGLQQGTANVPLFIGVPTVTVAKKFDLRSIVQRANAKLADLFVKNLKA